MNHRIQLALFIVFAVVVLFLADTAYQAVDTYSRLKVVEAERDQWQRPSEIIRALDLKPGNVVVDLGCGSGYFTLKLSPVVGDRGRVLAEDIRKFPLLFLWFRKVLKSEPNIKVLLGAPGDPHLPTQAVDAVLIANTYHEFKNPRAILAAVARSLVSGGRLVVVDRSPRFVAAGAGNIAAENHEVSADQVAMELKQAGFQLVARQDRFIDSDPDNETWWLITSRKP